MIDHLGLFVSTSEELQTICKWYETALAPIGYAERMRFGDRAVGFGPSETSVPFWIGVKEEHGKNHVHIAFTCPDDATVDKCYEAAIKAGGKDNGKPGERPHYHPGYYAGFVIDPAGNGFEIVHHGKGASS